MNLDPLSAACLTVAIVWLLIVTIGVFYFRRIDKELWNGGICAENGQPWRHFDSDSGGDHGYKAGKQSFWSNTYFGPGIDLKIVKE